MPVHNLEDTRNAVAWQMQLVIVLHAVCGSGTCLVAPFQWISSASCDATTQIICQLWDGTRTNDCLAELRLGAKRALAIALQGLGITHHASDQAGQLGACKLKANKWTGDLCVAPCVRWVAAPSGVWRY